MAINDDSYYWLLPQNLPSKSYFDAPGYTQLNTKTKGLDFGNVKLVLLWLNKNINAGLTDDNMYGAKTNEAINKLLNNSGVVLTDEERLNFINLLNSMKGKWVGAKVKNPTQPAQVKEPALPIQEPKAQLANILNLQQVPYDHSWVIGNDQDFNNYTGQPLNMFGKMAQKFKRNPTWIGNKMFDIFNVLSDQYLKGWLQLSQNDKIYLQPGRSTQSFLLGGTMGNQEELQKAFMAFLIEDAAAQGMLIQSEQDLQAYAQQLGEEGLKAKYQEFMQKMQGGVKAALGAKLNYIRKIKGLCPEGEELVYMKQGGRVCPVCLKKRQEKVEMNQKGNAITKFKDSRKEDKYDVNEHNDLIRKYRNKTISKEELDRLHNLNKHPNTTHEESDWATERPKPKSITNKKKLVDRNACGSKMKKK